MSDTTGGTLQKESITLTGRVRDEMVEDSVGHFDFVSLVRDQAKVHGVEPERLLWLAAKAMFDKAAGGDAAAAKLIFDRACGVQEKSGGVNVNVDNRRLTFGPPAPAAGDVGEYIAGMNKVAAQIGIEINDEIEDLLS